MKLLKRTVLVAALQLVCTLSIAQIEVSSSDNIDSKTFIASILSENEQGVSTVSIKNNKLFISLFSKSLNQTYSKEIKLEKQGKMKLSPEKLFSIDDNLVVLASSFDKASKSAVIYSSMYSKRNGTMISAPKMILKVDVDNKRRKGEFGIVRSDNEKYTLVYHIAYSKVDKSKHLELNLFDEEMTLVKKQSEIIKSTYWGGICKVGNDGSFIFNYGSNGKMNIYSAVNDYEKMKHSIQLEKEGTLNPTVSQIQFHFSKDKTLFIMGYYNANILNKRGKERSGGLIGSFNQVVELETGDVIKTEYKPLNKDNKFSLQSQKEIDKKSKLSNHYKIKEVLANQNGDVFLISEYYTVSYRDVSRTMQQQIYTYGSLIVTKINKSGTIEWNTAIKKTQRYTDTQVLLAAGAGSALFFSYIPISKDKTVYYSYTAAVGESNLYIVFNDIPANFVDNVMIYKKIKSMKKLVPALVTVDEDGGQRKRRFDNKMTDDVVLRPKISTSVNNHSEILVYSKKKKVDKLIRLSFE